MTTIREQVLAALQTVLAGIAGVNADRNLDTDPPAKDMPAAVQFDGGHEVVEGQTNEDSYALEFSVEGYVTGADTAATTAAVDDLYGKVVKALGVDRTLGGLASDLRHTGMGEPESVKDRDAPYTLFDMGFEVVFVTVEGDPYNQ